MNAAHLYKRFGDKVVLEDVSLTVPDGAVVCLMAPSGRGKTTLLRCIAGLEMPDSGTVTGVPERLGFVFQEDRLCPQLDAVENVRLVTGRAMSGRISRRTCGSWDWRTAWTSGRRNCPADSGGGCPLPGRCVMCRSYCCWMSPSRVWMARPGPGRRSILCGTGTARRCCASPTTGRTPRRWAQRSWKYEKRRAEAVSFCFI